MPAKFFCCLPLNFGYAITGITCWLGVFAGIGLVVYPVKQLELQTQNRNQLIWIGALLLIANVIPALTWLVSLFVKGVYYMHTYANSFLFFPILVQAYILAFDIQTYVWYRKQVASGTITPDQVAQTGTQITLAFALIAAGLVILMSLTAHCYCCILAVAKRE